MLREATNHREDTLSHRERVAAARSLPCAESSASNQRSGGVRGRGRYERFRGRHVTRHQEDTLSHRERVAAARSSPCAESSANSQRAGGVRGRGLHERFCTRFLGSCAQVQQRARQRNGNGPHPGTSALAAGKLIHGPQECALQCRPSPAGRGWPTRRPRVPLLSSSTHPCHPWFGRMPRVPQLSSSTHPRHPWFRRTPHFPLRSSSAHPRHLAVLANIVDSATHTPRPSQ